MFTVKGMSEELRTRWQRKNQVYNPPSVRDVYLFTAGMQKYLFIRLLFFNGGS